MCYRKRCILVPLFTVWLVEIRLLFFFFSFSLKFNFILVCVRLTSCCALEAERKILSGMRAKERIIVIEVKFKDVCMFFISWGSVEFETKHECHSIDRCRRTCARLSPTRVCASSRSFNHREFYFIRLEFDFFF